MALDLISCETRDQISLCVVTVVIERLGRSTREEKKDSKLKITN